MEHSTRIALPYIRGPSEAAGNKPNAALRTALVHAKDKVPAHQQAGVFYVTPCHGCEKRYLDETGKQLRTRPREHRLVSRRADPKSHVWQHCAQTGHESIYNCG